MTNSRPLILNGREVADEVLSKIKKEINNLKLTNQRLPGLSVILIGDNPASQLYVKNKEKACNNLGIITKVYKFPSNVTEDMVLFEINNLNKDINIDGILLQLPLPMHLKAENLVNEINPAKDVDGLHPLNLGKLLSGQECLKPCTPEGVIQILNYYSIDIQGLRAVVIGRSTLVGKPLGMLLLSKNASVTLVHTKSENIQEITKFADILISAIGKPKLIKRNWIKKDSIIIDVGISEIYEDGKSKIAGDVDFEDVYPICKAITPVPGGMGPVTIAMLMKNTLKAYKLSGK